jgi:hypothetical protein
MKGITINKQLDRLDREIEISEDDDDDDDSLFGEDTDKEKYHSIDRRWEYWYYTPLLVFWPVESDKFIGLAEDAEQDMDVEESRDGAMEDATERFEVFKNAVSSALQEFQENPESENGIRVEDLEVQFQTNKLKYRRAEVEGMLRMLEAENWLLYADGLIHLI